MASDDDLREQANGLILGLVMVVFVVAACWLFGVRSRTTDFVPEPELAGEHSVLVHVEDEP